MFLLNRHPEREARLVGWTGNEPAATLTIGDKLSLIADRITPPTSALPIELERRLVYA
ncbi:hypothetical protein ABIB82_004676 [Bradyrhizobium sp. i1.8.4]